MPPVNPPPKPVRPPIVRDRPINVKGVDRSKWRIFVATAKVHGINVGDMFNMLLDEWLHRQHSEARRKSPQ